MPARPPDDPDRRTGLRNDTLIEGKNKRAKKRQKKKTIEEDEWWRMIRTSCVDRRSDGFGFERVDKTFKSGRGRWQFVLIFCLFDFLLHFVHFYPFFFNIFIPLSRLRF